MFCGNQTEYDDYVNYCIALRKATQEGRRFKVNFEKKLADGIKQDPKSFYSYIKIPNVSTLSCI